MPTTPSTGNPSDNMDDVPIFLLIGDWFVRMCVCAYVHKICNIFKIIDAGVINYMNDNKNNDIEVLRTLTIVFFILAHIAALLSPVSTYWKLLDISRFGSGVDLFFVFLASLSQSRFSNRSPRIEPFIHS